MTTATATEKSVFDGIRVAAGIAGLLAVIVGVLILVWPGKTAMIVTAIIAIYAVVAGVVYVGIGALSRSRGGWARTGQIVLGIVFLIAGVLAFLNLGQTTAWLGVFLGVLVGVMWIIEGVVALSSLSNASSKIWAILFAVVSIIAGVVLLFSPLWGAVVLWMLLGISLIVLGVVNVIRSFASGRARG